MKSRRVAKISQPLRNRLALRNCLPLFMFLAFDFSTSLGHFLVFFPFCPSIIAFSFSVFCILYYGLAIKAPKIDTVKGSSSLIKVFRREAFSSSHSFSFSLFSLTLSFFSHKQNTL